MRPAVELSYLDEDCQRDVVDEIDLNDATPSHDQTIRMRKLFNEGNLTTEAIHAVMSEEKPNQKEKIVLRGDRVRQLIPKNIPVSQTEDFVCKALEHYNKFLRNRAERDSRFDLPGYGYARRGQKGKDQIRTIIEDYILEREQMTNLFVLIDSRLEPQKIDLEFMEWLGENGIPFSIIFTKADKLKGGRLKMNINAYLRELSKQWEELPPHFVSSSEDRTGRIDILNYIENINKDLNVK